MEERRQIQIRSNWNNDNTSGQIERVWGACQSNGVKGHVFFFSLALSGCVIHPSVGYENERNGITASAWRGGRFAFWEEGLQESQETPKRDCLLCVCVCKKECVLCNREWWLQSKAWQCGLKRIAPGIHVWHRVQLASVPLLEGKKKPLSFVFWLPTPPPPLPSHSLPFSSLFHPCLTWKN